MQPVKMVSGSRRQRLSLLEHAGLFTLQGFPESNHLGNLSCFIEDEHGHARQNVVLATLLHTRICPGDKGLASIGCDGDIILLPMGCPPLLQQDICQSTFPWALEQL